MDILRVDWGSSSIEANRQGPWSAASDCTPSARRKLACATGAISKTFCGKSWIASKIGPKSYFGCAALFERPGCRFELGDLLLDDVGVRAGWHVGQAVTQMLQRTSVVTVVREDNREQLDRINLGSAATALEKEFPASSFFETSRILPS